MKLPPAQFDEVKKLEEKESEEQLKNVNPDYYLFQFSNDELKDVLMKPDEWNFFDQLLARKLLLERNVALDALPGPVNLHEVDRSYSPTNLQLPWVLLGYVCALFLPHWGIAMGTGLLIARRTLKDGRKVNMYDQQSRNHGWAMIVIGVLVLLTIYIRSRI